MLEWEVTVRTSDSQACFSNLQKAASKEPESHRTYIKNINVNFAAFPVVITNDNTSHLRVPGNIKWPFWVSFNGHTLITHEQEKTRKAYGF